MVQKYYLIQIVFIIVLAQDNHLSNKMSSVERNNIYFQTVGLITNWKLVVLILGCLFVLMQVCSKHNLLQIWEIKLLVAYVKTYKI